MVSFFFFKQKTAYEMRISDWSSDVCSSDLNRAATYAWDGSTVPSGPHLRFNAGIVTLQAPDIPGDVIASGNARLVIPGGSHGVGGSLETRVGGEIGRA